MARPKLPKEVKIARGTYRPSRDRVPAEQTDRDIHLAEYEGIIDVETGLAGLTSEGDRAYLAEAEQALRQFYGIDRNLSTLYRLCAEHRQIAGTDDGE